MLDDAVAVRLTPAQAKHIAASMRIALAARFEGAWADPLPDRADIEALRALVNSYADELAMLEWGEPQRDVELLCQRVRLERLARELIEAGAERINDQPIAGREGTDMISAAHAINSALHETGVPRTLPENWTPARWQPPRHARHQHEEDGPERDPVINTRTPNALR